jgi:hypothetical protein
LDKKNDERESSQLDDIVKAMKELEDKVTTYRQGATDKENTEEKSKTKRKRTNNQQVDEVQAQQLEIITDNQVDEVQAQQEVPSKGNN